MKIYPKATYAMAYNAFIMLYAIPSHHFANAAATEDDDLQKKVHLMGEIDAPSNVMVNEPVAGVLPEKEMEKVGLSQNTNMINDPLLESNHKHDGTVDFTSTHDVSMQRKLDDGSICSDDITWTKEGNDDTRNCAWVRGAPEILCRKKSSEGVRASEACPIACGEFRTKECTIPQCDDDSWFLSLPNGGIGKKCNGFLTEKVWRRCYLPVVNSSGDVPKFFAYEYCSKCSEYGNACVHSTDGPYDAFVTKDELKDAVSDYCADPEAWTTDPNYAKYGPIEEWDVSNISDMSNLFYLVSSFIYDCNPNIGGWDVSSVTDFYSMFYKAWTFNQDIGGWDVSSGTNFKSMFELADSFNQDISGWDVSNGTNFSYMFQYADSFNQDLCGWDIDDSASTYDICAWGPISCGACSF